MKYIGKFGQLGIWMFNGIFQAVLAICGVKASWFSYFILLLALIVNIAFEIMDDIRKDNIYNMIEKFLKERRYVEYE